MRNGRHTGAAVGVKFTDLFIRFCDDVDEVAAAISATLGALLAPSGNGQDAIIDVRHVDGFLINDVERFAIILSGGPMYCAASLDT